MFFRVQVFQSLGPSFRSSRIKLQKVQIQVYKESNISVYVIIVLFVYFSLKKVLTCEIKRNTFYSDNVYRCLNTTAATA